VARGKGWPRRRCSCSGSSKGGGTIGVRNGGKEGLGRGVVDASCKEDLCPLRRTGQAWAPAGEESLLCVATFGARSAGLCCSGTAAA